ncbi:phage tail tape measure protein [Nonlabens sp. Ci31]|jgi:hypothetical protein|uniref:phage tail tape measure protein n=1 Tax=Nonlabens sp. Ci31 TaxID=2608253 RepID=UPI001462C975|nr:phage tail tape measure protein [Nonlabens sp. Ci31]QJP35458.1 phage tail tape measure protein [Nonlabens sp. Ci31]
MSEIKIEKKKAVWPWILLALVLLVAACAAWFFFSRNNNTEPVTTADETVLITTADETVLIDIHENNKTVAAYVRFIDADTLTMGLDHVFTSEAFTKLTNAVDAMATESGYDVEADIAKAKQLTDEITKAPFVTTHANKIRSAADVLSTSLQNIQQAKYPGLSTEAADVKSATSAIKPETLTLEQRDAVKSFFRKAADLLNKMN